MSSIAEGKPAPEFSAQDEQGNLVKLSDFKGKKNVVLYFYPKDDTPGCTIEACNFRDSYTRFQDKDTQILGVSFDDAGSHQAFKDKFQLPFPLLVDEDRDIARAYGVKGDKFPNRDTLVIDKAGCITRIIRSVDPGGHDKELLEVLEK
ncbi:MAG: peroxiredoxin [bacterium]|nr:peroxiredoxin [bacterium]